MWSWAFDLRPNEVTVAIWGRKKDLLIYHDEWLQITKEFYLLYLFLAIDGLDVLYVELGLIEVGIIVDHVDHKHAILNQYLKVSYSTVRSQLKPSHSPNFQFVQNTTDSNTISTTHSEDVLLTTQPLELYNCFRWFEVSLHILLEFSLVAKHAKADLCWTYDS